MIIITNEGNKLQKYSMLQNFNINVHNAISRLCFWKHGYPRKMWINYIFQQITFYFSHYLECTLISNGTKGNNTLSLILQNLHVFMQHKYKMTVYLLKTSLNFSRFCTPLGGLLCLHLVQGGRRGKICESDNQNCISSRSSFCSFDLWPWQIKKPCDSSGKR